MKTDIGQGLNAGLLDVGSLLDCLDCILDGNMGDSVAVQKVLRAFSKERVKEGSSIARLMPKLVPYQYNLRGRGDLVKKSFFDLNNRIRNGIYQAVHRLPSNNRLFYPSPVSRIMGEPPVPYSVIWREYQWNSGALIGMMAIVIATVVRRLLLRVK
jgi:2-polyprenyl-6-methoxyphenol hydroxylase-like FAD-dependent oxidoreductase